MTHLRSPSPRSPANKLNHLAPAARETMLGDALVDLITNLNAVIADRAVSAARANTAVLNNGGLVIHGSSSTLAKIGTAISAIVGGVFLRKAANTDMAALVGTLATAKSAAWPFYIDATGALTTGAKTADVATHDLAVAALPVPPAGLAMIGFVVLDNATGSNFVGGTTALDAASLTATYYNTVGAVAPAATPTAVAIGILGSR